MELPPRISSQRSGLLFTANDGDILPLAAVHFTTNLRALVISYLKLIRRDFEKIAAAAFALYGPMLRA